MNTVAVCISQVKTGNGTWKWRVWCATCYSRNGIHDHYDDLKTALRMAKKHGCCCVKPLLDWQWSPTRGNPHEQWLLIFR